MGLALHLSANPLLLFVVAVGALLATDPACAKPSAPQKPRVEQLRVKVVRTFPHDPRAFTQGLLVYGGKLYESTGLYGRSSLRQIDLENGVVERQVDLPEQLFGEGLARVGGWLIQLTWREGRALVWNLATLCKEKEFSYQGEGWGLCFNGRHLVMSDGSDRLTLRDPESFTKVGEVLVRRAGKPVHHLNELECVDNLVYANVWQDDHIARIDLRSGEVTGWIDATGLLSTDEERRADVLNGIGYLPTTGHLILTGKLWPRVFEVEIVPANVSVSP